MNILLVTEPYPPQIRAVSFMMKELAEELYIRGYKVTVVTSWPSHNIVKDINITFNTVSIENGVTVVRVKTIPLYKFGYCFRGFAQLALPYLYLRKAIKLVKGKIDVVIVYSPPLPLVLVGKKIKKIYGAKYLLNIQDIFPQNAIDLDIIKNKLIIKLFNWIEKKGYSSADKITSHSDSCRKYLMKEKQIPPDKISTVYNWIDLDKSKNIKRTGNFREKFGLNDKFIFLFAGMMGPSQDLDFVIKVAEKVSSMQDICFLLVGDGSEKERLQKKVEKYKLENVKFRPFISKKEYSFLLKDVDVGLASLSIKNKTPVIPGKIIVFMASSVPVIAFLNKESDGHYIIKEAKCGYSILSDDWEKAADLVKMIYNERGRLLQYGRNGYQYVVDNFSKNKCIDKLEHIIQNEINIVSS